MREQSRAFVIFRYTMEDDKGSIDDLVTRHTESFQAVFRALLKHQDGEQKRQIAERAKERRDLENDVKGNVDVAIERLRDEIFHDLKSVKDIAYKNSSQSTRQGKTLQNVERNISQIRLLFGSAENEHNKEADAAKAERVKIADRQHKIESSLNDLWRTVSKIQTTTNEILHKMETCDFTQKSNDIDASAQDETDKEDDEDAMRRKLRQTAFELFSDVPKRLLRMRVARELASRESFMCTSPDVLLSELAYAEVNGEDLSEDDRRTIREAQRACFALSDIPSNDETLMRLTIDMSVMRARMDKMASSTQLSASTRAPLTAVTSSTAATETCSGVQANELIAGQREVHEKLLSLRKFIANQRSHDLGRLSSVEEAVRHTTSMSVDMSSRHESTMSALRGRTDTFERRVSRLEAVLNDLTDRVERELSSGIGVTNTKYRLSPTKTKVNVSTTTTKKKKTKTAKSPVFWHRRVVTSHAPSHGRPPSKTRSPGRLELRPGTAKATQRDFR